MRQENAVVLWAVAAFAFAAVALAARLPWWAVPGGLFILMALSPLYIRQ
jgi:hypothetical protein